MNALLFATSSQQSLRALNVLTFDIGTQFDVVTVSIDPEEKACAGIC